MLLCVSLFLAAPFSVPGLVQGRWTDWAVGRRRKHQIPPTGAALLGSHRKRGTGCCGRGASRLRPAVRGSAWGGGEWPGEARGSQRGAPGAFPAGGHHGLLPGREEATEPPEPRKAALASGAPLVPAPVTKSASASNAAAPSPGGSPLLPPVRSGGTLALRQFLR